MGRLCRALIKLDAALLINALYLVGQQYGGATTLNAAHAVRFT